MEVEIKKDSKKIEISKDTIILVLIIALIVVSAGAVFLGCFREEGNRNENSREGMMRQYQQSGKYIDDNNVNPNDAEVPDDQNIAPAPTVNQKPAVTNTVAPVTPVVAPKAQ